MTLAPGLEVVQMSKRFGNLLALQDVSMKVAPGSVHALLGGNGAGKSTLVKCIMGYYRPDHGQVILGPKEVAIQNPRDALALGIGMVYQHFTLVQNMTVAENMVLSRATIPRIIDWDKEYTDLRAFMKTTPFFIDITRQVSSLSAGEKQKLEICKQLYLKNRLLFLDEPTSVLTPQEADEVLSMLRGLVNAGELTVLMITHKFREVMKFCDDVTVLRTGKLAGKGSVKDLTPADMSSMMIGSETTRTADRLSRQTGDALLEIRDVEALDDLGLTCLHKLNMKVRAGEIVGVAGVSGNGQAKLVEVLAGQRKASAGEVLLHGEAFNGARSEIRKHNLKLLPEEPLRNACVGPMSVAGNIAMRSFDVPPSRVAGFFLNRRAIRKQAVDLIQKYRVKTPGPDEPIRNLSGGNVQRAVLARELSGQVDVLITANPCFGLDFAAASEIRAQIMEARNRGVAVLLISEDLDEVFELSDRIVVMFHGSFVYETPSNQADIGIIGRHMAGHGEDAVPAH
ncbi:ABC transporter ATP-binding protein [Humisphaera borealis]|nr:ABC transporter ATP-binding protein [Humisphaera borealis]